jgi:hypothetical protein
VEKDGARGECTEGAKDVADMERVRECCAVRWSVWEGKGTLKDERNGELEAGWPFVPLGRLKLVRKGEGAVDGPKPTEETLRVWP